MHNPAQESQPLGNVVPVGANVFFAGPHIDGKESFHTGRLRKLCGSHEITELTGAPWTSYLVSARTIEVPVFKPAETQLLLTEPVKYSRLWPRDDPHRPRFEPGFWGEGGIARILEEAGGWPHLVQLIAGAVVDLINDEEARTASPALVDRALAECVVRGHNVFYELMHRECTLPGESATEPRPRSQVFNLWSPRA